MLALQSLQFGYDRPLLSDISLTVAAGEIVALLGTNGAGKSTVLRLIAGWLTPQRGTLTFDGQTLAAFSRRELAQRIALVAAAEPVRFPLTALEYVLTARFAFANGFGFTSARDAQIAHEALQQTDAAQFATRPFNTLSSGERQRVVLARALAQEARLLLLDEPTANADLAHQVSLLERVQQLARARQLGVLLVTHEINLAAEFADRIALLHQGRLLASGTPAEVCTESLLTNVFATPLLVDRHPQTGKPRITLGRGNK